MERWSKNGERIRKDSRKDSRDHNLVRLVSDPLLDGHNPLGVGKVSHDGSEEVFDGRMLI
jgi:hypothetical protein